MFTTPLGNEVVVTVSAAPMVIDSGLVAVAATLSVTCTVKLEAPAALGVPLMVFPVSVRPGGSVPALIDQV